MLRKRYTLQEIASMAGVSITTASMVLNGKARQNHISPKTEERILKLMQKEHFTPNASAQAIVGGRTHLIGFVMRDEIDKSFWAEILAGVNDVLEKADFHLVLSFSSGERERQFQALDFLRSKRVDAYVLVPGISLVTIPQAIRRLQEYNRESPVILLTTVLEGLNSVTVSEKRGGVLAAQHLLSLGHRRLAAIGDIKNTAINARMEHFASFARRKGAEVSFFPGVEDFLPQARRFTGAFCFSDTFAVRLCNQCTALGIRVPEDLSIVGYDNQPVAELCLPKLTTIHQPKRLLGQKVGQLLLRCLEEKDHIPEQLMFSPKLVVRDSTAPVTVT